MKFWAASMTLSIACLLLLSTASSARFAPSLASASIAVDSFLSCAFRALISLTKSLLVEAVRPLARMVFSGLRKGDLHPQRTPAPEVSGLRRKYPADSAVPDVLRHRQS